MSGIKLITLLRDRLGLKNCDNRLNEGVQIAFVADINIYLIRTCPNRIAHQNLFKRTFQVAAQRLSTCVQLEIKTLKHL